MVNRKLKSLRVRYGDTQEELSQFLGIRINTYNWKENGRTKFTLDEAFKIAKRYGESIENIFFNHIDDKTTTDSA